MANHDLASLAFRLIAAGKVTGDDVLALRRAVYADAAVSESEAEILIRLALSIDFETGDWPTFFAEALSDIVVNQVEPEGYVTQGQADWLLKQVALESAISRPVILHALMRILELARSAPNELTLAALRGLKIQITTKGGVIDRAGVELARRIVFAGGGGDSLAVSRSEAEVLFDIDGALVPGGVDPSWPDFFARAVGNHLLSTALHAPPPAAAIQRSQQWLDEPPTSAIGGFLSRMTSGFTTPSADDGDDLAARNARMDAAIASASALTGTEIEWVVDRLARDGKLSEAERRLKSFILEDRASLPPTLSAAFAHLAA